MPLRRSPAPAERWTSLSVGDGVFILSVVKAGNASYFCRVQEFYLREFIGEEDSETVYPPYTLTGQHCFLALDGAA